MSLLLCRITASEVSSTGGQTLNVLIRHRAMHQVTPRLHADLPLVQERAPGPAGAGDVQVCVLKHHLGVIAAEFQCRFLQHSPTGFTDLLAHGG